MMRRSADTLGFIPPRYSACRLVSVFGHKMPLRPDVHAASSRPVLGSWVAIWVAAGLCIQPMLRLAYLSKRLTRPLPTKDGRTLRTVAEVRTYMLGLSKDRELRAQWQRAAELLLAQADVADFSKQI
jgi:hypothetical protein